MEEIKGTMEALADMVLSRMTLFEDELRKVPPSRVDTVSTLSTDFCAFRAFVMATLAALQRQIDMLAVQSDAMEMRSRSKMLLLHEVTEQHNEDTPKVVVDIVQQKLLPHVQHGDFSHVHRMGANSSVRPRPIILTFKTQQDRDEVWAAKVGLKGSGITLSEFLTKRRHKLFLECRERFGVQRCWTRGGRIVILGADSKRHIISCNADLEKVTASQAVLCKNTDGASSSDPPGSSGPGSTGSIISSPQTTKQVISKRQRTAVAPRRK